MYFVIFSPPRSGSTLLQESLDSHPDIICINEPLHPRINNRNIYFKNISIIEQYNGKDLIEWLEKYYNIKDKVLGIKLVYTKEIDYITVIDFFKSRKDIKIILLNKNLFECYASFATARIDKVWHPRKEVKNNTKIRIDKIDCQRFFLLSNKLINKIKQLSNDLLEINYEDLWHNYQETINKCFNFLNLEPINVIPSLKKINKLPIQNQIINYNEIKNFFKKTNYNKYFI